MTTWRFVLPAAVLLFAATQAHAEDSAYCRKVRARAMGDAALLFAPSLQAQGIHFPANGTTDAGLTTGSGYQFRAALAWSPLDFYRGFRVLRVGDADCAQHEVVAKAAEILAAPADYGRLPALRKEAVFLDQQKPVWDEILAKTEERLGAGTTTLVDTNFVRMRVTDLERKRAQVEGDIARLRAVGAPEHVALSSLVASIDSKAKAFEREASHVRTLDAWTVSVVAGIVPQDTPVDYFGVIQVSYNFGGIARNVAESHYLDARSSELAKARYEVQSQVDRFRAQAHAAAAEATHHIAILERQQTSFDAAHRALATSDAPSTPQALATIDLERIAIEADRIYLTAYVHELSELSENGS